MVFCHQEKSQITHNGYYNGILFQGALFLHKVADDSHNLVAVNDFTVFVHCQQSVRIAVKCQTHLGLLYEDAALQLFHMGGTAVGIDIGAVRIVVDSYHLCSQFL